MIPNCAMHMIRLGRGTTTVTLSEHASKPWSWVVKACRINCNGAYLRNKTSMKSALKGQPGIRLMLTWHHSVSDLFFESVSYAKALRQFLAWRLLHLWKYHVSESWIQSLAPLISKNSVSRPFKIFQDHIQKISANDGEWRYKYQVLFSRIALHCLKVTLKNDAKPCWQYDKKHLDKCACKSRICHHMPVYHLYRQT